MKNQNFRPSLLPFQSLPDKNKLPKLVEVKEPFMTDSSLWITNRSFHPENDDQSLNSFPTQNENSILVTESMQNMDEAIRSMSPLNRMTTDEIKHIGIANRFNFSNYEYKKIDEKSSLPNIDEYLGVYTSKTIKEKPISWTQPLDLSNVNKAMKDYSSKIGCESALVSQKLFILKIL